MCSQLNYAPFPRSVGEGGSGDGGAAMGEDVAVGENLSYSNGSPKGQEESISG